MHRLVVIAHDIRSAHNVGSLLRTAEGLGIDEVILSGYTPYPSHSTDHRLPHLAEKISQRIAKTSLGAENSLQWRQVEDIYQLISDLKQTEFTIMALEQAPNSIALPNVKIQKSENIALLLGNEVQGIRPELLALCDKTVEIPMHGKKESFNVIEAATMAMYQFTIHR